MNWQIIILGSMCTMGMVMLIDLHTRSIETRNQAAEQYLLSLQEFYAALQEQIRQMHRCRHDLAKHIQMLEFLREDEQGSLRDYRGKLRAEYKRQKELSTRYCRHEVVNIILLLKERQCQNLKLPFAAAVSADSLEMVENLDWVGLLYNLLDNAIEASQRTHASPKGISLHLTSAGRTLILTVENQVLPGEKPGFSARKDKKGVHGLGLEIVDGILSKYQGERSVFLDKRTWRLSTRCTIPLGEQSHE